MKNLFSFSVCLLACCLLFNSCSDDDPGNGIIVGGNCNASWTVNGDNFNEDDLGFCVFLENTFQMSSQTAGGDFIMQVSPITSSGTYTWPNSDNIGISIFIKLPDGTLIGNDSATVSFSSLSSGGAKGTFSGDFKDEANILSTEVYTVTNGKFEADF